MPKKTRSIKARKPVAREGRPATEAVSNRVRPSGLKNWLLKNKYAVILGVIVAAGAFLRLYKLDFNSIWLDEAATAEFAEKSFADIWNITAGGEYNPPLFYWLEHIMLAFGNNEITLRLIPALVGIATIPLMYFVAREFIDRNAGIIAAALLAFSPFHLFYSQEARTYTLMLFFVSLVLLFLLKGLRETGVRAWVFFGVFAALAFWAHFYTAIPAAVFWAYAFGYTWFKFEDPAEIKRKFRNIGLSVVIFIALTLPLLIVTVKLFLVRTAAAPTYGIQGFGIISQTVYQMSGSNTAVTVLLVGLYVIGLFVLYARDASKFALVVAFSLIPLIVSVFLSYRMPMLPRYLIYLLPAFFISVAAAYRIVFSFFKSDKVAYGFAVLFLLVQLPAVTNYYTTYSKEDWRGFAAIMRETAKPQDIIVLAPGYMQMPFNYYYRDATGTVTEVSANTIDELVKPQAIATGNAVYYIVTGDIYAVDLKGEMVDWLKKNTTVVKQYTGINLFKRN